MAFSANASLDLFEREAVQRQPRVAQRTEQIAAHVEEVGGADHGITAKRAGRRLGDSEDEVESHGAQPLPVREKAAMSPRMPIHEAFDQ